MQYDRPDQYEEWATEVHRIAALHEGGQLDEADAAWSALIETTTSDLDRSVLLVNRATTLTELDRLDDAEACLDQAIALEHRWYRTTARENKAAWLVARGRAHEALDAYRRLLHDPWASLGDRSRYAANIAYLEGR